MRPTPEQERTFFEHGFVVVPGMFSARDVQAAREAFERLYDTAQTLRVTGDHAGAHFVLDAPPAGMAGDVVVKRVVWAGGAEPVLLRLAEDPRLIELVLALLGTPRCEQLLCQAHFKMPSDGVSFDWHQDIQHRDKGGGTWRDVNGRGSYVQTILLVDDMRADNGPLQFLPDDAVTLDARGRLTSGHDDYGAPAATIGGLTGLPRSAEPSPWDESRAVTVTGRAGDVLIFGPHAVHGSLPNTSTSPRRVLINGYAAPGANARVYPGVGSCRVLPAG
jgi:ectoine hydroxylase-related dioxygenase (phytanoyl-CoA dioxygenase family)